MFWVLRNFSGHGIAAIVDLFWTKICLVWGYFKEDCMADSVVALNIINCD